MMKKIFSCICVLICLWNTNTLAEAKCDTYIMGKCFSCHSPMTFEISSDEICQMICPKDRPLYHWSGECYPCNYPDTVPVLTQCLEDKKICDVCPNRTILPLSGGNRPSVLNCPKDKPLMDINGICFSCDTPLKINITEMEDSCHKNCSNQRVLQGNLCVKK